MIDLKSVVLVLAGCAALASPALAQFAASDGQVNVSADHSRMETGKAGGYETTYLDGRVELQQNGRRLRCDHAKVIQASGASHDVVRMEATGNVFYVVEDQTVRGDYAVYTKADDTLKVTGEVVLVRGRNVATGNLLIDKVHAGEITLDSEPTSSNKGRVHAVMYPNDTPGQSKAPPRP